MHIPRDFNKTRFKKRICISKTDYDFINTIRGRKSQAGKLEEIISFYREEKHLNNK